MECEVFEHCKAQKNCDTCSQWYKSYVQKCIEKGLEPTMMRTGTFNSLDVTPTQGEETTKKEAAKELNVSKATVDTYLSAGKLKGDGQGGVDDESVKAYKRKREENMKKTKEKVAGVAHKEEFVAEPRHIDSYSKDDPDHTEYIVTKGELMEAFRIAKEMGYKEGYAACKKEQHRERLTKKELLQLIA